MGAKVEGSPTRLPPRARLALVPSHRHRKTRGEGRWRRRPRGQPKARARAKQGWFSRRSDDPSAAKRWPPPLAVGATYAGVVYAGGPVSGAHYNPATTVALLVRGNIISAKNATLYMLTQALAALCAHCRTAPPSMAPSPPARPLQ